jgi:hypothetical protein
MKVLFLMLDLPSDSNSSNLYLDLAVEFYSNGHDVYIIAPAIPNQKSGIYYEHGIRVLRVSTLQQKGVRSILKKGLAQLLLPYQYRKAYKTYLNKSEFDLILMPTPPITLTKLVLYIKKKTNAFFYLMLRDIYPQGAADIGLVKFQFIYNYLRKLEILTYKNADIIGCMSQGNIDYITKNNSYIKTEKLKLLPNWQKEVNFSNLGLDVRRKYNIENKFIVLFGGTIGYAQKVDNIVILAERYRENQQIVFFVIGNGVMKQYLKNKINEKRLENVVFMDGLPRDEYMNFVKTSNLGLITIDERFTVPTIPSKTTSYLCLKLPVLAVIDKHTDYGKILDEAGAGLWSIGGDNKKLFSNFDRFYQDESFRLQCGENGYKYFINHLTSKIAYENVMSHVKK